MKSNGARIPWRAGIYESPDCGCGGRGCGGCGIGVCGGCGNKGCAGGCSRGVHTDQKKGEFRELRSASRKNTRAILDDFEGALLDNNVLGAEALLGTLGSDAVNERRAQGMGLREAQDSALLEIFRLANENLIERQLLTERIPGGTIPLAGGRLVNDILGNVSVPIAFGENGDFFGDAAVQISQRRIDELNGFGRDTVQAFMFSPGVGGAIPFRRDVFIIDIGSALNHQWFDRIRETPAQIDIETRKLCLYVNGCPGGTIHMLRRPQPYYFIFRNPRDCATIYPYDPCDFDFERNGFYFTTDLVGGGPYNILNGYDPDTETPGRMPCVFQGTRIAYPIGDPMCVVVSNIWPDNLFYQSLSGPFMGGFVRIYGNYRAEEN